jgi:hypothetical protein
VRRVAEGHVPVGEVCLQAPGRAEEGDGMGEVAEAVVY